MSRTRSVIQTSPQDDTTTITTISGKVSVAPPGTEYDTAEEEPGEKSEFDEKAVVVPKGKELTVEPQDRDLKTKKPKKYDKKRITELLQETHIPLSLESFQKFSGDWIGGATVGLTPDEYSSTGSAPFSVLEALELEFGAPRPMGKTPGPSRGAILNK